MNAKKIAITGLVGASIGLSILSYGFYLKGSPPTQYELKTPIMSHKQAAILIVSKDKYISEVIAKSKYPYTIAAIAKVESDFTPRAVGDKGRSWGMYQIQQQIWKEFDNDTIEAQTDKIEDILDELIRKQGYYEAIKSYNGRGRAADKYRQKVLVLVKQMEKQERILYAQERTTNY